MVGNQIYCQAKREVEAWINKNGKAKFLGMLASIKSGVWFDTLYGPLLTK